MRRGRVKNARQVAEVVVVVAVAVVADIETGVRFIWRALEMAHVAQIAARALLSPQACIPGALLSATVFPWRLM